MANIVELREKSGDDLEKELENAREAMFNLRFQRATGQIEDYSQLSKVKKEIAQLKTVLHEREKAIKLAASSAELSKTLSGKNWQANAQFDYEQSHHVVVFLDEDEQTIATAQVDLNKRRRGARKARRLKPVPQQVIGYEVER